MIIIGAYNFMVKAIGYTFQRFTIQSSYLLNAKEGVEIFEENFTYTVIT